MSWNVSVTNSLIVCSLLLSGCGGGSSGNSSDSPSEPFPSNVALAGSINIEANTRVDLDTGDSLAIGQNPLSVPQELPVSFVLAGYVSEGEGFYPPLDGLQSSRYVADPVDEFRAPLRAGDTLVLQTFAARTADGVPDTSVTFSLTTVEGVLLDGETTDPEAGATDARITLPGAQPDGEYRVVIEAQGQAPVRYVMTSPSNALETSQSFEWADHEFMPGEAIVTMAPGTVRGSAAMSASGTRMSRALGESTWLVLAPLTMMQQRSPAQSTLRWLEGLRNSPGISLAIPNYLVSSHAPTAEPFYPQQWHYSLIDAPTAWQLEPDGGAGVTVAVLDSGLFRESASSWHSDLNANVVSGDLLTGSDFVDGDDLPADPGNSVGSSVFHGTHVAGTVAAVVNDSGGTGVAFGSTLLPVRVLGEGGTGSSADLLDAIRWVGGLDDGRDPRADIANMSLGDLPFIQPMQNAITAATEKGVIFVAAAGNSSSSVPSYPAAFENVFSISAVDGAGDLASYSNYGNWIDLAAPGGDATRDANSDGVADRVLSTSAAFVDDELKPIYTGLQGTSMAAPHFAGVLALMKGAREGAGMNYNTVLTWLVNGDLTDSGTAGRTNDLGYGVLDAGKALFTAISDPSLTILSSSPSLVSLNTETQQSETVTLSVLGNETQMVSIQSVNSGQNWFDVSVVTAISDDTFTFEVGLIPEELEPGAVQRGTITVSYTSDVQRTLDIPVSGQRITDRQARDAGRHFVLLVRPEPNEQGLYDSVAVAPVTVEDGQYRFTFLHADGTEPRPSNQVPAGTYLLVAGSDPDNDNILCQAGEACAEYPVSGLRQE
ncbi:S8 family serine peptidase, partial [Marinobacter sp.]